MACNVYSHYMLPHYYSVYGRSRALSSISCYHGGHGRGVKERAAAPEVQLPPTLVEPCRLEIGGIQTQVVALEICILEFGMVN